MTKRVITGAGRGIGRATAEAFVRDATDFGIHVVLASRPEAELSATAEVVRAVGGEATTVVCDVTAEPQVKRRIDTAAKITGRIDIVVCNAGVAVVVPLFGLPPSRRMSRSTRLCWDISPVRCNSADAPLPSSNRWFWHREWGSR